MISAGIDPSTKTGLVVLDSDKGVLLQEELSVKGLTQIPRAVAIVSKVLDSLASIGQSIDHICIEGYSLHSKFNLATMVELGTILRVSLMSEYSGYYEVAPTCLKKFVTGKGNSNKTVMLLEMYKRFQFDTNNDNIADAAGLAYMPLYLNLKGRIGLQAITKVQEEALTKMLNVPSPFYTK